MVMFNSYVKLSLRYFHVKYYLPTCPFSPMKTLVHEGLPPKQSYVVPKAHVNTKDKRSIFQEVIPTDMDMEKSNSSNISSEYILVGGIPTPLIEVSWDYAIPNCFWKNKIHVPNHEPGCLYAGKSYCWALLTTANNLRWSPGCQWQIPLDSLDVSLWLVVFRLPL